MSAELLDCIEIDPESDPAFVVIWLHGLGADGQDFKAYAAIMQLPASLAVRYVFPNAPKRSVTVEMGTSDRAWFDICDEEVSGNVDLEGIESSVQHLRHLIQRELDGGCPPRESCWPGFRRAAP